MNKIFWKQYMHDLSNIITNSRYVYILRSWNCIIRYVDGDICTRLFSISQIQKYCFVPILRFSFSLKVECLCLLSCLRRGIMRAKDRNEMITLTSNLCSTLSPAKTLLAVTFIVMYPSSLGIIMNDTLEPELAFTSTFPILKNFNKHQFNQFNKHKFIGFYHSYKLYTLLQLQTTSQLLLLFYILGIE